MIIKKYPKYSTEVELAALIIQEKVFLIECAYTQFLLNLVHELFVCAWQQSRLSNRTTELSDQI